MRILARVNLSLPWHGAGAEVYLHSVLREMVKRGHECRVLARSAREGVAVDGVAYEPAHRIGFWKPDIVIGFLDDHAVARDLAQRTGAAYVTIWHNHRAPHIERCTPQNTQLGIWNSEWTRNAAYEGRRVGFSEREIVIHPPVDPHDYTSPRPRGTRTSSGYVTLVNLQPAKGVYQATELAHRMPDQPFLFVVGAYGEQYRPRVPNIKVVEPVEWRRMREDVYNATSVLLMPSEYESYGRCAVEAAWAGVPTIAHPTGGLVEALDVFGAGIFAHRDRIDEWQRILECLDDAEAYAHHSAAARTLARHRDPAADYDTLEAALRDARRQAAA
jgi:glycosyltransferase involved in cell wall biosynthesis